MNISKIKLQDTTIFIREWASAAAISNSEAVILLHGIESHSEWFTELAQELADIGYDVLAYDRDGWGMSSDRHSNIDSYAHILRQLTLLSASLRKKHSKVHLVGLSWGGMFALYAVLRRRIFFDSLGMIAPGIFPNNKFTIKQKLGIAASIITKNTERKFALPINLQHFTDVSEKKTYIKNDPLRNTEITASTALETLKMQSFCAHTVSVRSLPPTALLLGTNDKIIDNTKTKRLFRNQTITTEEFPQKMHSLIFEDRSRVVDVLTNNFKKTAYPFSRQPKKILVMGAGAVGSMVGGLLALAGNEVMLIGRKEHVDTINKAGLTLILDGIARSNIKECLQAAETVTELTATYDIVIIAVKSFDTATALEEVRSATTDQTVFLSLQNGTGNEMTIQQAYPDNTILAGAICAYLNFIKAGTVSWSDDKGGIGIGLHCGSSSKADETIKVLQTSGLEIQYHKDGALRVKWSKMLLNIAFNALNAITGLSTSEILTDKTYGNLASEALREAFKVMRKEGIRPIDLPGYKVTTLEKLCQAPNYIVRKVLAKITANETNTVSSMQQDLTRGKKKNTEISELNGKIVASGKIHAIPTPANKMLCKLLAERQQ